LISDDGFAELYARLVVPFLEASHFQTASKFSTI
jgi:hypothetical protein